METRVALISIIVENNDVIDDINRFLHEAGKYIIGRMGIPYREKGINIISIAIDAPPYPERSDASVEFPPKRHIPM